MPKHQTLHAMVVFGTRPEAIKMAPVVKALEAHPDVKVTTCVTAQHREMLDQVLAAFDIKPNIDLDLMEPGQSLERLTGRAITAVSEAIRRSEPDWVLVHGDTTTTMAASLAAFYNRVRVGHVEAGLRTHDRSSPFPEEVNRRVAGVISDLHFVPTERAKANLLREGVDPTAIHLTGNTVIDALQTVRQRFVDDPMTAERCDALLPTIDLDKRLILVTGHRRESFGKGFQNIAHALKDLAERDDVTIVYPVHLNPMVSEPVHEILNSSANVQLIPPLDYLPFIRLMSRADLVVTDSGGVQEEAPSFGIPVLVMRDTTERPEAVEAGTVKLVGSSRAAIGREVAKLLDDASAYTVMANAANPYGDGHAAPRIVDALVDCQNNTR